MAAADQHTVDESTQDVPDISHALTEPDEGKRPIHFTEKGEEHFKERVANYQRKLSKVWDNVAILLTCSETAYNLASNKQQNKDIVLSYAEYRLLSRDFVNFLRASRSCEGDVILGKHIELDKRYDSAVTETLEKLEDIKEEIQLETRSIASKSSRSASGKSGSKVSSSSRVDLERARLRLEFAEKEAALKRAEAVVKEERKIVIAHSERKEDELQAQRIILKEKCRLAEAEVKIKSDLEVEENSDVEQTFLPPIEEDAPERTRKYVNNIQTQNGGIIDTELQNQPSQSTSPEFTPASRGRDSLKSDGPRPLNFRSDLLII